MDAVLVWGLGLVYVMLFMAVWRAFNADDHVPQAQTPTVPPDAATQAGDNTRPPADAGRCQACGAVNEPGYTYCRDCILPLG